MQTPKTSEENQSIDEPTLNANGLPFRADRIRKCTLQINNPLIFSRMRE
jgi:hypothetical protein